MILLGTLLVVLSLGLTFYAYLGYPLLLAIIPRVHLEPPESPTAWPIGLGAALTAICCCFLDTNSLAQRVFLFQP